MPRRARLKLAGVPVHLIQRGNNRGACFFAEEDCRFYLDRLGEACHKYVVGQISPDRDVTLSVHNRRIYPILCIWRGSSSCTQRA
jgi:hypothetical protein